MQGNMGKANIQTATSKDENKAQVRIHRALHSCLARAVWSPFLKDTCMYCATEDDRDA